MRRWVVVVVSLALVASGWWLCCLWVGEEASVWLWSGGDGSLRVLGRGLAVAPRWSSERLPRQALQGRLEATTRDGVPVTVMIAVAPPVGELRLAPGHSPTDGLVALLTEAVRRHVAGLDAACLEEGAAGCAADPEAELRGWVASSLRLEDRLVTVRFDADASVVHDRRLAEIVAGLERPPRKVLLLGLDGLDWDLVLPWVEAGRMPNLRRLMDEGTWGTMETMTPMLSPLIWTTMATGVPPDVHGVLDFVERDPVTGSVVPVTGRLRKVPALWNIASALGLEVGVVGWWASWPADRVHGAVVTDRLYYTLSHTLPKDALRGDPPHLVSPEGRRDELIALRDRAVAETNWASLRYFMRISEDAYNQAVAADRGLNDPIDGMRRIMAATRTYLGAGLALAEGQPDLLMVYLEGTDTIGHLLAPYMPPPTNNVEPHEAQLYVEAVPKYFEVVDRWIARYLEQCPLEEYAVVVVSDHGFKWHDDRPGGLSAVAGPTAPLWHADDAVFVVAGAGVETRGRVDDVPSVYDVATTIAALLGIPAGAGWPLSVLPGCPAPELEPVDWLSLVPPASYQQGADVAAPEDPEFVDMLRAIGYIDDEGTPAEEPPSVTERAAPRPTPGPATSRGQLNNLALIKLNQKLYDEAEALFRQALAMSPDYAAPHYNMRRLFMETGRYVEADRELWLAVDKGLRDPARSLDRAAGDYDGMGMPERSLALLSGAIERFPGHEPLCVHRLVVLLRLERCEQAMAAGAEATGRFPDSGPIFSFYGLAALCAGDTATARTAIERSLEINPAQPVLHQALEELREQ